MGQVVISPNMKKTSLRLDPSGNVIDPKTKQVVEANEPEYKPTKEEIEAGINKPIEVEKVFSIPDQFETMSVKAIAEEIKKAEAHLVYLSELKKKKIDQMKKELAELEA